MKRVALILFFLFFVSLLCSSHSEASLGLFVGTDEVELKHPLVMINGNFMIPADVFAKYLGAEVNTTLEEIELVFADQTILMQLGEESAQVDGVMYKLDVAPQLVEEEIVVPIRFIANRLGLSLVFDQDSMALRLESSREIPSRERSFAAGLIRGSEGNEGSNDPMFGEPELSDEIVNEPIVLHHPGEEQDLSDIIFMGGPRSRVFLDLHSYTGYQTHLLTEPDRLVIDLYGVGGEPLPTVEISDHPVVRSIRSSRFDEQTMRIVCDLHGSTGYRVNPWPQGGLEIEFNFQLTSIELEQSDGEFQLRLDVSAAPVIEVVYLEDPLRLVLDVQETTLMIPSFDRPINQGRIARLRVSQHTPSVTRIVLQVTEPMAPLPLEQLGEGGFALPLFSGTASEAHAYLARLQGASTPPLFSDVPIQDGELSGLTVVVDPGHGGSDPGAIGYHGSFEKDINLAISLYLGEFLSQAGAKVVYTRDSDAYVSIFERPEIAAQAKADLFISVHTNAHIQRGTARGTETLYRANDPASELLARTVQDEVVQSITLANRRIWGRSDLAVFDNTKMPAIMVEVGFLDHPDEEVLLRAPGFQEAAAQGIFNGIRRFYLENKQ